MYFLLSKIVDIWFFVFYSENAQIVQAVFGFVR